jgi:uncharacterized protein (TIGR02678 family)
MTMPVRPVPAADPIAESEVRTAARALLRHPLLVDGRGHDDELRLVRRHRAELARLFAEGLGYRLVVEPGAARLFKTGLGRDHGRGLRRRSGAAFTPRGYALLSLTIAFLTRCRAQLMVDELVAGVRAAAAEAGVDVDLDSITDRRALHGALVLLCDLGVLSERDGDLDHWAEQQTLSLLDVHRDRLALLVAAPLGGCRSAADVVAVSAVPSAAGGARVAVRRRLVERPVLSHDDLTDEQVEWWRRNRNREKEWFHKTLGLELELRAEGALALDPDGELTDRAFPAGGSARHFALLLLEAVVNDIRDTATRPAPQSAWESVAMSTVRQHADMVFGTWREGFKKTHRDDPDALFEEALTVLTESGLVRRDGSTVHVHAAGSRFAPRPELVARGGQQSLFEEEDS